MKVYIVEYKTSEKDNYYDRLQAYGTMEKAQSRMREMAEAKKEEYPAANSAILPNRANIWLDCQSNTNDSFYDLEISIFVRELEVK